MIRNYMILLLPLLLLLSCSDKNPGEKTAEKGNFLSVRIPVNTISSAEHCRIEITLHYGKEFVPVLPDWEQAFAPLKIIDMIKSGKIEASGEYFTRKYTITLEHLLPGDYILQSVKIPLEKDDTVEKTLTSDPVSLKVVSSLVNGKKYIDNYEPVKASGNKYVPIIIALSILFLLILFLILYFAVIKRRKQTVFKLPVSYQERIKNTLRVEDEREYYSELLEILREFLDHSLFLSVQSSTREEFMELAAASVLLPYDTRILLFDFMERCEAIAFGKNTALISDKTDDMNICLEIINEIEKLISRGAET